MHALCIYCDVREQINFASSRATMRDDDNAQQPTDEYMQQQRGGGVDEVEHNR